MLFDNKHKKLFMPGFNQDHCYDNYTYRGTVIAAFSDPSDRDHLPTVFNVPLFFQ